MNLVNIVITPQSITKGLDIIRHMKSIRFIGVTADAKLSPAEFWKKYDAGEFGKPATPAKLAYLDPAFQQWVKATQALPAEQQVEAVSKKLMELNPGFDGTISFYEGKGSPKIENGVVTQIWFFTDNVADISPVRALAGLKILYCPGSVASKGRLSDLSPLEGMKLTRLHFRFAPVSDLSPLRGMPLDKLMCYTTPVSDLSPLEDCKSLTSLMVKTTKVTAAQVVALQKALPNCKVDWDAPAKATTQPWNTAEFQAWVKQIQALPAEKQIDAVSKKLMELNPGFDGNVTDYNGIQTPKIVNGVVPEFGFATHNVTNISPVRALTGLTALSCKGSGQGQGKLSDLSQLEGMKLTSLNCTGTHVADLSPLIGMPLTAIHCNNTPVSDLSPLRGMPLTTLYCYSRRVSVLSPLQDCKSLKILNVTRTKVTPAQVAALQKALPNCKIEWDGEGKK